MGVRSSTVAGIAVLAASLGLAACGGSHSQMESEARAAFQYAAARCRTPVTDGTYSQVHLHNSGIPCQEAVAIAVLTPGGRGKRPDEINSPAGPPWYCLNLPPSKAPLALRCNRGQQFFTVEKVKVE